MAYPVVASTSTGTYQNFSSGSATVSLPSGTAAGDLMIAIAASNSNNPTITPPSGWTAIVNTTEVSNFGQLILWKYATAADITAGSYSFSISGSGSNSSALNVGLLRITGAAVSSAIDVSSSASSNGTAPSTTSVTPKTQELYLILIAAGNNAGSGTVSGSGFQIANNNPSWTTQLNSYYGPGIGYTGAYVGAASANGSVASATGAASATLSNTSYYSIAILAITAQPITPSPLSFTANQPPIIIRRFLQPSPLTSPVSLLTPTYAGPNSSRSTWRNTAKSTSAWTNQQKS